MRLEKTVDDQWKELVIPLDEAVWTRVSSENNSSTSVNALNLDRLVAWNVGVTFTNGASNGDGKTTLTSLFLDHLSCISDGDSLLNRLLQPKDVGKTETIPNRNWIWFHYNSDKSEENSELIAQDDGLTWDVSYYGVIL